MAAPLNHSRRINLVIIGVGLVIVVLLVIFDIRSRGGEHSGETTPTPPTSSSSATASMVTGTPGSTG